MSVESRRRRALWSAVSISIIATAIVLVLSFAGGGSAASSANEPTNTQLPTISGTAEEGQQLTATQGGWDNHGSAITSYAYVWQRCDTSGASCNQVQSGSSSQYTLVSGDVGSTIRVKVTATNGNGPSAAAQSAKTSVVVAGGTKPKNTKLPTISGTAQDNQILTADPGTWTGASPISFAYQWQRCDSNGANCVDNGGTDKTYKVVAADVGHKLLVSVTASNSKGSDTEKSGTTSTVTSTGGSSSPPSNSSLPSIAGTAQDGQTFTSSTGSWTNSPTSYTYQWQRCDSNGNSCAAISGATSSTYRNTSADVNHRLRVMVTAKNASGQSSATSLASNIVSAAGTTTSTSTTTSTTTPPNPGKVIPVTSVVSPNRLIVSSTHWTPRTIGHVGQQITARVRIIDSTGTSVSGALVYATGVPYNRITVAPETFTDASGWATLVFVTLKGMPIKKGALLQVFMRTRKQGDDILGGVSSRRLVSVRVVPGS